MSTPNKLHSTLQSAAEFIAICDNTDEFRQKLAPILVRNLREHIAATEKLLQSEAERTGFWDGDSEPTVHPTSLQEVLDKASEHIWLAERNLDRLRDEGKDSSIWNHWYGRQCGLITLLQLCGALPIGPRHRASDAFHRQLVALRPQLPGGFELFSVGQALELFMKHGIEATAYEVPYLQRHLVAGLRKHKDVVLPGFGSPGVLDDEALTVTADFDNGSSKHQASVEPVASQADCSDVQAPVPTATNDQGAA
ncbi:hypothetical protein QYQ99_25515 [Comamonas testosteroni]|uniref:hypothetical protein n=1 Tax=Comamonas testosteroni TaxID=285 RepID=UPI00265F3ACE|nr:hypothetical protein [Comamonas testosteroni]WKL15648.1 hypothetical protein QYQ99_25515 [Comamonas testosteroni]